MNGKKVWRYVPLILIVTIILGLIGLLAFTSPEEEPPPTEDLILAAEQTSTAEVIAAITAEAESMAVAAANVEATETAAAHQTATAQAIRGETLAEVTATAEANATATAEARAAETAQANATATVMAQEISNQQATDTAVAAEQTAAAEAEAAAAKQAQLAATAAAQTAIAETIAPTPTPDALVTAPSLNLRLGPGTDYEVITALQIGTPLNIVGRNDRDGGWIKVIANPNTAIERDGWITTLPNLVTINIDLQTVNLAEAPPTPIPVSDPFEQVGFIYPAPIPTFPDNGAGAFGTFPPLTWEWDGELAEDEFFEVRIWHESIIDYHPALGWVKSPPFDFNISQEREGIYFWTVAVVKGENWTLKDWIVQSGWPYNMYDGNLIEELSPEAEQRTFKFTPGGGGGGTGSPISEQPACGEPPCD
ncbi:MAG: SH3 domain-containing protein [Anaerolineae bacterium]|nr:SH3 domain-containing protein [Anaerolineae bacterium]